jgi:hypothetical protein
MPHSAPAGEKRGERNGDGIRFEENGLPTVSALYGDRSVRIVGGGIARRTPFIKEQKPLNYADPALNKKSRAKDFLLLMIIGTVFAIAYGGFLFWWVLFR